jgi:hypothetical protein
MRVGGGRLHVGIVRAIHRSERSFSPDPALEFFRRFLCGRFFQRIGATAEKKRARDPESEEEGFQERRILKEVISDK